MTLDKLKSEQTVVWCLGILADGTIMSGDSMGNVKIWDGKSGTQGQSFKGSGVDVLCLAVGSVRQVSTFFPGRGTHLAVFICRTEPHSLPLVLIKRRPNIDSSPCLPALQVQPKTCADGSSLPPDDCTLTTSERWSYRRRIFPPYLRSLLALLSVLSRGYSRVRSRYLPREDLTCPSSSSPLPLHPSWHCTRKLPRHPLHSASTPVPHPTFPTQTFLS